MLKHRKTPIIMIGKNLTARLARRFRRFRATAIGEFVAALVLFTVISASFVPLLFTAGPTSALAVDATWLGVSSDWNTAANWSPTNAPVNFPDTATFNTSTNTSPTISANTNTVSSITFSPGANAFTIQVGIPAQGTNAPVPGSLILQEVGIVNNSTNVQTIENRDFSSTLFTQGATVANVTITNDDAGGTQFFNTSTAGSATITNDGGAVFGAFGGFTEFVDTSTAGSAAITNDGGAVFGAFSGFTVFVGTSTAGSATITNDGGAVFGADAGFTAFLDTSTAGSATITNEGGAVFGAIGGVTVFVGTSTAGSATITNEGGIGASSGTTFFFNTSNAGNATIINEGGAFAGFTAFLDTSTAGSATIINNGAVVGADAGFTAFFGTSTAGSATIINDGSAFSGASGGFLEFFGTSTAGSATITNNGGTGGGAGGSTLFLENSDGGTALAITNGNGFFDISALTSAGMGIGSIEGSGNYFLGSKNLSVGGNNLSTTVSGVIQDGGTSGGTGGSLTKIGVGTLTLTGVNTYTGGTIVGAGTLQLGNGGTTGGIVGNVIDNGILAFNRSDSVTFSGLISGTGGVQQNGSGTTVLVANNTYTGGTTINAGTLQLGNGGTTGSIIGNIINNGILAFNRIDPVTFNGLISGTGGVQQNGSGTTVLVANNTYTGGTTINAGTLHLGNGGTTGSIVGNVINNGILAFNRSDSVTFNGLITGTGGVQHNGSGTTVLVANNSYTGGTIINGGTLQLGDRGTTGSITGNVVDNAILAFNRSDFVTFGGVITGTGSVQQNGTGTTLFVEDNTYTGGTVINAGALQLGNGGTTEASSGTSSTVGSWPLIGATL